MMDSRELDHRLTNIEEALEQILLMLAGNETETEETQKTGIYGEDNEEDEDDDEEEEGIMPPTKPSNTKYTLKTKEPRE